MNLLHKILGRIATRFIRWYERIWVVRQLEQLAYLGAGVHVGGPINLGQPSLIQFGDDVSLTGNFHVKGSGGLSVGNHTHIGEDVLILTENHKIGCADQLPYGKDRDLARVVIGDNVWICDRVTILPGAKIREGAIIMAGAVIGGVQACVKAGGNPGRGCGLRDKAHYEQLKAEGKFVGWPRDYDFVMGARVAIARKPGRPVVFADDPTPNCQLQSTDKDQ